MTPRHALLESLIGIASQHVNEQLLALAGRLAAALLDAGGAGDARAVHRRFKAGNLLKSNSYAFLHLASAKLERAVRLELARLAPGQAARTPAQAMTLVPYEEMDSQVAFGVLARPFELLYADQLATLNVRLAFLLDRGILRPGQNPFRPEVFLSALHDAWCAFDADAESQPLLLPLFRPGLFLDLGPMLDALNLTLMQKGATPGAAPQHGRRADSHDATPKAARAPAQVALAQQLRQYFSRGEMAMPELSLPGLPAAAGWQQGAAEGFHGAVDNELLHRLSQVGAKQPLLSYLARLQAAPGEAGEAAPALPHNVIYLPKIKESAPQGSLSRADESTIDLLSAIFETVFQDKNISQEIRDLIRFLQIPVLKAALVDKDFFFQEAHPARRLIDLLSRTGWEQRKGPEDPLFQAMQRSVERVGRDFDHELSVFAEAVTELEASIQAEEQAAATAIAEPIASALKQEKLALAAREAKQAVALRIGSGEVLAVVETFLENKWVSVMTIAYSVEAERTGAVGNATRTMDELIWSVKPKPAAEERRLLIGKLPALLAGLNKWLDIIKWQDAERLQFFAELAECHASIVRAPLELSPERQVEIALEVAQQAAQRRLARHSQGAAEAEAPADAAVATVAALQRNMWMAFAQEGGAARKVKLVWISPLRTLFIFSADARREAFSLSGEALAQQFRAGRVDVIEADGAVGRALQQALEQAAAGDAGLQGTKFDFQEISS
ncbi:DUF1631 family protein [Janthinobacterium fluminis]|uniref:DUF1631 family protein n=1 Tax=Janthinobacterium fluminis TaxID=2987524 RepID=A0ABT5K5C1_9BURK|nr:DUF1631 family protein [Janthinobacterium fluminis]MDC8759966.1 DUF1631 family protein [Janthinobacterium fluminis]